MIEIIIIIVMIGHSTEYGLELFRYEICPK